MDRSESEISIQEASVSAVMQGFLAVPPQPMGVVLFAHGSGSSRYSPRNRAVASELQRGGLATLLIDLLTEQEDKIYAKRFDILFLVSRLRMVSEWLSMNGSTADLPLGLFGSSTGGAAALCLAAEDPSVRAVVSRGGRPDLAGKSLLKVRAPTLLIVGGADEFVLELNREAFELLECPKALKIVPGASHLFEEPGALEQVAHMACEWFQKYLGPYESLSDGPTGSGQGE